MTPRTGDRSTAKPQGEGNQALGGWIRTARLDQGVSQRALASRAGISRSYLCDIEHGRGTRPSVPVLDKLAVALGTSRWDVLRAAGILEPLGGAVDNTAERRLLSLYRDLSDDARAVVERFARFMHAEEHRWIQASLVDGDDTTTLPIPAQTGPTLFDGLVTSVVDNSPRDSVRQNPS
ncbi:MAG: helix-turn-helix domain-containing protein [Thermomicrobiales bacterium]